MTNLLAALLLQVLISQQANSGWQRSEPTRPAGRVVAEFEPQAAIMIAWAYDDEDLQLVQAEIVARLIESTDVIVLAREGESDDVRLVLETERVGLKRVRIVEASFDTLWIRDYGPQILLKQQRPWLLDFHYADDRPADDAIPDALGSVTRTPVERINLAIDGGNLLTNGQGLVISTQLVFDNNRSHWRSVATAEQILGHQLSARRVVLLEQLIGEPTGHVDMFATFTDANTVVVAQLDPRDEPENAAILDRNAAKLARLKTAHGSLRVLRIPMPAPAGDVWYSYTNVLYANGTILLPRYTVPHEYDDKAVAVFRRALPKWTIKRVDSDLLIDKAGAIHCATLNLPRVKGTTWEPLLKGSPAIVHAHLTKAHDAPPTTHVLPIPSVFLPPFVRDKEPEKAPTANRARFQKVPNQR